MKLFFVLNTQSAMKMFFTMEKALRLQVKLSLSLIKRIICCNKLFH